MPAIDTDDLSAQFVSQYRDNVFCNKQKVFTTFCFYVVHVLIITFPDGVEVCQDHAGGYSSADDW